MAFSCGGAQRRDPPALWYRWWRFTSPASSVRLGIALLLFAAAVLKTHQLSTEPLRGTGLLNSRAVLVAVVEYEVLLAFWLLSGLAPGAAWWVAATTFGLFAVVAASKGMAGESSCGCFGRVATSPWFSFWLDVSGLVALCSSRVPPGRWGRWGLSWDRTSGISAARFSTYRSGVRSLQKQSVWLLVLISTSIDAGCNNSHLPPPTIASADNHGRVVVCRQLSPVISDETDEIAAHFDVVNPTPSRLRVTRVLPSCGCLAAMLGKRELGPNDHTSLDLTFRVKGQTGQRSVHCILETDRGVQFEYSVKVTVISRIEVSNAQFSFGSVDPSSTTVRTLSLRLHALAGDPLPEILDVKSDFDGLRCSLTRGSVTTEEAGILTDESVIRMLLRPRSARGPDGAHVQVRYRYQGKESIEALPVFWLVPSLFQTEPSRVFFVVTKGRSRLEQNVLIRRCDGGIFSLTSARTTSAAIGVNVEQGPALHACSLRVTVDCASITTRVLLGEVRVDTDYVREPELVVPVTVLKPPYSDEKNGVASPRSIGGLCEDLATFMYLYGVWSCCAENIPVHACFFNRSRFYENV